MQSPPSEGQGPPRPLPISPLAGLTVLLLPVLSLEAGFGSGGFLPVLVTPGLVLSKSL